MKTIKILSVLFILFYHTNALSTTLNIPANTTSEQSTGDLGGYSEVIMNNNSTLDINQVSTGVNEVSIPINMGNDQSGGNLTIDVGDAAITLTGDTNISGVVTISSGALEGNISPFALLVLDPNTAYVLHADKIIKSLSGTANSVVDLGTNNLTIGRQGASVNPETYSGNITGTGGVIIDGGIHLALNGENTYTGDTTINSGTLTTTASSLVGNITNNSNLIFNQSTNGTYAGNISGSGPVTIEGGGSVTLTGTNNNTGKVTINNDGSSLIGSTSNIPRNILNNSTNGLVFNQSTDGTYGGDISGSGKVTIEGGGVVTLTGTNSYTGITSINGESGVMGTASMFLGGVENNGAQGLIFSQSTDTPQTYAGDISGSGKVTIQTDEILNMTFTGNNSYTGGTVIDGNNSTLTVTTSNILGRVLLANDGFLIFNQSTNGTYAGDITGIGQVSIYGGGTITLTGTNSYSRGTFLNGDGSALIGNTTSLKGPIFTNSLNAGVTFDQSTEGTYVGAISGVGPVTIKGGGKVTFGTFNYYTGITTINNDNSSLTGTIITNDQGQTNGSLPAAGQYMDDGTLIFSQSSNGIFSGSIQGNGKLIIDGSVSFSSTSSISSSIKFQNNGSVTGNTDSLTGDIVDNGSVVFDQAAAGTYAGKISGTGSLIKEGTGRLNMTAVSPLTGPTTIKKGALAVNGSLENSSVTVNKLGRVEGNGTIGSLSLAGTVAPGNSIGTLTVLNDFTMLPTGAYEAELNKSGHSDQLNVEGRAFIDGTLDVRTCHCDRSSLKNKVFSILSASEGVVGRFANLISRDRVKYLAQYLRNGIQIAVTGLQDFADASSSTSTSNVARTERYFDTFADNTAGRPDLTHVINILDGLLLTENAAVVNNAFNQIQPAQYGDLGGISFLHNELVNKTVSSQQQYLRESRWIDAELRDREEVFLNFSPKQLASFRKLVDDKLLSGFNTFEQVSNNRVGPRSSFLTLGGETQAMRPGNQRMRVGKSSLWVQSYGQIEKSKSNHGNPSIRSQTGGLSIGGDHEVLCNTYLGILGGFSTTPFHWNQDRGYGRMKSYYGGLYGTWLSQTGLYADGQIIAGGDQFHSKRNIKFPGINRIAKQSHKAGQFSADAEVGYAWMLQPFTLQPFLDGTYMFAKEEGFKEKGAQSLNFKIKSKTSQFLRGEVGAQIYRTYVLGDALVRPAFQLSYVHKHPISGTHVKGGLIGEPQTLTLLGDSKVRNQVAPAIGVTVQFAKGLYIIANVSAQLGSSQNLGDALVRVGYDF